MKPIEFPEQNKVWTAAPGTNVSNLPAYTDARITITCWQMTWPERLILLLTGRLWLSQMNFARPLQPQKACVRSPFEEQK